MNFRIKMLLPVAAVFAASILVISYTHYKMLEAAVKAKTTENLGILGEAMLAQVNHLNIILDATKQTLDEKHLAIAKSIAFMLDNVPGNLTTEHLRQLADPLDIIELSIADKNGIITNSSVPRYIGFDYRSHEITSRYLALAEGTLSELSEEPRESVFDDDMPGEINHYVGLAYAGGFIQIGFNAAVIGRLRDEINIERTIQEMRIGENGYGMALQAGAIIAHPDEALIGRDVSGESWYRSLDSDSGLAWIEMDGEKYFAGYKNSGGVMVVALVPQNDYYRELRGQRAATLRLLIPLIALMAVMVYFILGRLLRPINHLAKRLAEIAQGNLDAKIEGSYHDEFDTIKDAINAMLADIKTYMDGKIHAQRVINDLNVSVMLSQIQPHFMFNSLTSIIDLCDGNPQAQKALFVFSEYLRFNMDSLSQTQPVPFETELRHVKQYLWLEQLRFEEKLRVEYDIGTTDFMLPVLTVQPIVENAVRHGLLKKEAGGTVIIKTEETGGSYRITVTDNGVGFDPLQPPQDEGRSHVGIDNVRSRLAALCGGTLAIHSKEGEGTTVVIEIPKEGSHV